jgi:hypothetical protein
MTKDKMLGISICHLYDYKMIIVLNEMDNDDMSFQCDYQIIKFWTTYDYHVMTWTILTYMLSLNDYEMTRIWRTN